MEKSPNSSNPSQSLILQWSCRTDRSPSDIFDPIGSGFSILLFAKIESATSLPAADIMAVIPDFLDVSDYYQRRGDVELWRPALEAVRSEQGLSRAAIKIGRAHV